MKRVIVLCLVCVVTVAQGCSAHKAQLPRSGGYVYQQTLPPPSCTQAPRSRADSEEMRIARLEAITTAVVVAGRVACEVIRIIR